MAKTLPFTGSGVALITPFTETGVDYPKLKELINWHIDNKTDAIIICGTTGEASTMPDEEHMAVIEYTVKEVAGRIPVIAGTGSNDTPHAIALSSFAKKVGADGLLLVTPYYNKTTQKGLYNHYKAIAEAVDLPIILYNVPSRTGMSIALETLVELAKIDNIVAIKEASGDMSYATKVAAKCPELYMYSGNDDIVLPLMSLGGKGVISVAANVVPEDVHNMCEALANGDIEKGREYQLKMLDLMNALFVEVNPIPVKTAMNLMGFKVGPLRMPLCDMAQKNLEVLKNAMTNYGIKIQK